MDESDKLKIIRHLPYYYFSLYCKMFKCLYCVKYFQTRKGRSHHESPYCTRILQQNVVNADDNAGFDFFTYEECELNSKEEMPHIVNEDLTYVHMQESY